MSNREGALVIFIVIAILGPAICKKEIRSGLWGIITAGTSGVLGRMLLGLVVWFSLCILLLWKIGWWDISDIRMTGFWFVAIALPGLYTDLNNHNNTYFIKFLTKGFSVGFILAFIVNLFSFPLGWELVIVLLVVFLSFMQGVAEYGSRKGNLDKKIALFFERVNASLLSLIVICSLYFIVTHFNNFATIENVINYVLNIIFLVRVTPYLYSVALYADYESLFSRIKWSNRSVESKKLKKLYWDIIKYSHINLSKLSYLSKKSRLWSVDSENYLEKKLKEMEDNK